MASAGRIPVFIRVGTGDEHLIGSLPVSVVPPTPGAANGEPVKVSVTGGPLATAELLEAVAAELRAKHAEQDSSGA